MIKNTPLKFIFILITFLFASTSVFSQGPGSLFVDAGPDTTADCTTGGCVNLTATFLETFETASENYTVASIPYNPPFPFNGLSTALNPNIDDAWSPVDDLPFDFCFFGNLETQFQVGSNGVLRFDVDPADTSNGWAFSENLPNNTNATLGEANVFTPVHDIDPSVGSTEEIGYEVLGTYPNRVLVVAYFEVPLFSDTCNNLLATQMAVFYEYSNVIEIYIKDKPSCPTWNSGNAAVGIQNDAGAIAFVPPGRNTSDSPWNATNEAWRFTPVGVPTYQFEWLDAAGNVIGTTPTINVCATGAETYTAQVTYTNTCNSDSVTLTDTVTVTSTASFSFDLGPDILTCGNTTPILLDGTTGDPSVSYQWYFNGNPIPGAINPTYTATTSGTYLLEATDGTCTITDSIQIDFYPQPIIADPDLDINQCSNSIFDLRANNDTKVRGGQDPTYNITYHNSQAAADNGVPFIANDTAYPITGTSETIWVRIEEPSGNCYATASFVITLGNAIAGTVPSPQYICDEDGSGDELINLPALYNTTILNGQNGNDYTVTYHFDMNGADTNTNLIPTPYLLNIVDSPFNVFVRMESNGIATCYDTTGFIIELSSTFTVNTPAPFIVCDPNNDGYAEFNLHDLDMEITGGDPDLTVASYHGTQLNAEDNTNPLADPYTNDDDFNDVVWARVISSTSSCVAVVEITLEVRNSPLIIEPDPLHRCDYVNTGDGVEEFDLTEVEPQVLNGLDPNEFDIYYYVNEADAIAAGDVALTAPDFSQAIQNFTMYQNGIPYNETIYVLVIGNNNSTTPDNGGYGCYNIVPLMLIVDRLPVTAQPNPFEYPLCDDEASGSNTDEISIFDLTTKDVVITGGDPTLIVEGWYESLADEMADNPILNPSSYRNRIVPPATTLTPQNVFARVTNAAGCKKIVKLTLIVNPLPTPNQPTPLEECDDDEDGIVNTFMLNDKDAEIIGTETNIIQPIKYYLTQSDAEIGNPFNVLPIPYTNTTPFMDTVFARVEKSTTGCFIIVELQLVVLPLPDLPQPEFGDLSECDLNGDGTADFDLSINSPYVYGTQDLNDFTLTYLDAAANVIDETVPYNSAGETITVTIENNTTGCTRTLQFDLIVGTFPIITDPADMESCDDIASGTDIDGLSVFNLESNTDTITNNDDDLAVSYYETQANQTADNPIVNTTSYTSPTATIYITVENLEGCQALTTLELIVNPLPDDVTITPLEICDDENSNDGFVTNFMLHDKDDEFAGTQLGDVSVHYFKTLTLAQGGDPADELSDPYANDSAYNDSVWARVVNDTTGCFRIFELPLIVNALPAEPIEGFGDLGSCDDDNDGSAEFDLTINDEFVLGNQVPASDYLITYHTDPLEADSGANPIDVIDAQNYISSGETIYVRLTYNPTGCYRVSQFELIVGVSPTITDPADVDECDDELSGSNTDEINVFDLTSYNSDITNGDTSLSVEYYETQLDQDNGNPIADPTAYQNVDINGNPVNPITLFVSVFNQTGCDATTTLTLRVIPVPSANTPTPLVGCDVDNDGIYENFILSDKDAEILGGEPGATVSYYETFADAEMASMPIDPNVPYTNFQINPPQIIFARVEYTQAPNTSGCFVIVELELLVSPTPDVPANVEDLLACDDDNFAVFNLTDRQDEILGDTQIIDDFFLTYHITQAQADSGLNPITSPETYTNTSNPQTIYFRLEDRVSGCYSTGQFDLIVTSGPVAIQPTPLEMCDDIGEHPNDGFTEFDLTVKNFEITGGAPGVDVRYYELEADALNDVNRIDPEIAYTNTQQQQQTLYVRVINGNFEECPSFTTLRIKVISNPVLGDPDPLELCDDNNPGDGLEEFDLTLNNNQIFTNPLYVATYFESYADALNDVNQIPNTDINAYENITRDMQTIYVRVTSTSTGCFEIAELQLIVNPLPDDTAVFDVPFYLYCEINTDGIGLFDLTEKVEEILNGQDPAEYTVSFYTDPTEAASGTNPITNPTTHQNRDNMLNAINPQTIYTGITNNTTGCYIGGVQSFVIEVKEGAVANPPAEPYVICDNLGENDGIAEFDLRDQDLIDEILGGQDPSVYLVSFYETIDNAMNDTSPLSNLYTNIINPQRVYIRVTNDGNLQDPKCFDIAELILKVDQLPFIDFAGEYRLCVDKNGNPIAEDEGSMSPPVIDTGLDPTMYTFEWDLDGVPLSDDADPTMPETDSSIIALAPGEYTVTITENATECSSAVTATVTLSSPPIVYDAQVVSGAFSNNHTIEATAEGDGTYVFQLDDGLFQESGIFEDVLPGDHIVTIKDENGCGFVEVPVGVIDYPKYFTPNQDGVHDTWNIIGIKNGDPTANIYIFDRHGKLLKQISPLGNGWDGTYNGNPLPSSDYWFRIEYKEADVKKEFRGHFTLKR